MQLKHLGEMEDEQIENINDISDLEKPQDADQTQVEQETVVDIMEFLRTPTGDGPVEDYIEHPLNFTHSRGIGQFLRGLTGLVGHDLKLAVLDIGFGAFAYIRERKQ